VVGGGSDVEDSARRFITLVDVLYDQKRLLVADTSVPLPSLFGTTQHRPPTAMLPPSA
jgi:predicted ATPase